jgi:hypothetical protein
VKSEDNLGLTLAALERNDEAIAAYRTAIAWQAGAEHPSEQPLLNLGILLLEHNQSPNQPPSRSGGRHRATDPKIHEQLGRAYLAQGSSTAALQAGGRARTRRFAAPLSAGAGLPPPGTRRKAKAEFARTEALSGSKSTRP